MNDAIGSSFSFAELSHAGWGAIAFGAVLFLAGAVLAVIACRLLCRCCDPNYVHRAKSPPTRSKRRK